MHDGEEGMGGSMREAKRKEEGKRGLCILCQGQQLVTRYFLKITAFDIMSQNFF